MSPRLFMRACVALSLVTATSPALAKPIAFADGYTAMYEYGASTMQEAQAFYAPRHWWSAGAGYLRLEAEDGAFSREIGYARANLLLKRWNLPAAQGNVFAYGGAGTARGTDVRGRETAFNAGLQADYETLRIYSSLKTDYQHAESFSHRIDTLQLGVAPYEHRYGGVATWLVVQARGYTGGLYEGLESALLLRLFGARRWGSVWFEGGVNNDGDFQSMFMFNF